MSVKCEQTLDELIVYVWLLYDHQTSKYFTLYISRTELEHWQSQKGPRKGSVTMTVTFLVITLNIDPWPQNVKVHFSHHPTSMYEICTLKITQVIVSVPKCWQFRCDLDLWPQNVKVFSSHNPASMYEIWKLYVENYSSYCVRTKVLTKFSCGLDLWPQNV